MVQCDDPILHGDAAASPPVAFAPGDAVFNAGAAAALLPAGGYDGLHPARVRAADGIAAGAHGAKKGGSSDGAGGGVYRGAGRAAAGSLCAGVSDVLCRRGGDDSAGRSRAAVDAAHPRQALARRGASLWHDAVRQPGRDTAGDLSLSPGIADGAFDQSPAQPADFAAAARLHCAAACGRGLPTAGRDIGAGAGLGICAADGLHSPGSAACLGFGSRAQPAVVSGGGHCANVDSAYALCAAAALAARAHRRAGAGCGGGDDAADAKSPAALYSAFAGQRGRGDH